MAIKILTYMQTLLRPENLDLRIITNLNLDLIIDILLINPRSKSYNFINNLLQANRTALDL
jgi:mannose/fructose-specific phosphotransferase system component IIA